MRDSSVVAVVGILSLTAIEIVALLKGFDGQLFLTSVGAIFGIVGYVFGRKRIV